jgi:hypothetical protein
MAVSPHHVKVSLTPSLSHVRVASLFFPLIESCRVTLEGSGGKPSIFLTPGNVDIVEAEHDGRGSGSSD